MDPHEQFDQTPNGLGYGYMTPGSPLRPQNSTSNQTAFSTVPAGQKKRRGSTKKILFVVGLAPVILIVLFFLTPFVLGLVTRDIEPPDDSDLLLTDAEIPRAENAYFDFLAFGGPYGSGIEPKVTIYEPSDQHKNINIIAILEGRLRDDAIVQETVEKNTEAFKVLDGALRRPYYQDINIDTPEKITLNVVLAPLNTLRQVARIQALRALYVSRHEGPDAGMREAFKVIELGQQLQNSGIQSLIQFLVGIVIKNHGMATVQTILNQGEIASTTLNSYIALMNTYTRSSSKSLSTAIRGEYTMFTSISDVFNNGGLLEDIKGVDAARLKIGKSFYSFYYRPNETKKLYADWTRDLIRKANGACSNLSNKGSDEDPVPYSTLAFSPFALYFTENAIGTIILSVSLASLDNTIVKKCDADLIASATQLLLAMKAFTQDQGKAPSTLESLVPRYISEIPKDPYGNAPFRYSPQKGVIYSVGRDGRDDGGSEGDDWHEMKDPTFSIGKPRLVD
jgi:hypothetical protein